MSNKGMLGFIASLVMLLVLVLAGVASGYTTYQPLWDVLLATTVDSTTYPGSSIASIDVDDNYVYALFNYLVNLGTYNTTNVSIEQLYPDNGSIVRALNLYYSGANLSGASILAFDAEYAYAALNFVYLSNQTIGGIVLALNKANLSIVNIVRLYSPSSIGDIILEGMCRDGAGNIYVTGAIYNTSGAYEAFVTKLPPDLNAQSITLYTYPANYENIALNCVVGPDGYLYVAEQLIYYDSTSGRYYPVYDRVDKIDPLTMQLVSYYIVPVYNSGGYTNAYALLDVRVTSDGSYLYLVLGYTDDKPNVTSATTGASVIKLDTSLSPLWRLNISTDYYEEFDAAMGSLNGDVVVGGQTNYDYGTGLGTSYYKSFIVVASSDGSVLKAILFGSTSAGSEVSAVAIGPDGSVYSSSNHYSSTISYYDVTTEVQGTASVASFAAPRIGLVSERSGSFKPAVIKLVGVQGGSEVKTRLVEKTITVSRAKLGIVASKGGGTGSGAPRQPPSITVTSTITPIKAKTTTTSTAARSVEPSYSRPVPQPLVTGSPATSSSSVLVVKHSWTEAPPPSAPVPVPEPGLLVVAITVSVASIYLFLARRRHGA